MTLGAGCEFKEEVVGKRTLILTRLPTGEGNYLVERKGT